MRFFGVLILIVMAGVAAGIMAGKVVAGGAQPEAGPSSSPLRSVPSFGEAPADGGQQTSAPADSPTRSTGARFLDRVPLEMGWGEAPQVGGTLSQITGKSFSVVAPRGSEGTNFAVKAFGEGDALSSIGGAPLARVAVLPSPGEAGSLLGSLAGAISDSDPFYQASREVPSGVTVLLVALGDANLDGVVDLEDVLIVTRALGPVPTGPSFRLPAAPIVADWDGDVDVVDLALVAAHLGGQLP